jgi:hypothetical protein
MVGPRPPMLPRDGTPKRVVKHAGGWPLIDLTGKRFGKLVAIGQAEKPTQYSPRGGVCLEILQWEDITANKATSRRTGG